MNWCRLYHSLPLDLDKRGLSLGAKWLFVCSFSHCSERETDGRIAKGAELRAILAEADVPAKHVKELVGAGMWIETAAGYEVKNFLRYQSSSETIEAKRERGRERQRSYEERKRKDDGVTDGVRKVSLTTPETETETEKRRDREVSTIPQVVVLGEAEVVGTQPGAEEHHDGGAEGFLEVVKARHRRFEEAGGDATTSAAKAKLRADFARLTGAGE